MEKGGGGYTHWARTTPKALQKAQINGLRGLYKWSLKNGLQKELKCFLWPSKKYEYCNFLMARGNILLLFAINYLDYTHIDPPNSLSGPSEKSQEVLKPSVMGGGVAAYTGQL